MEGYHTCVHLEKFTCCLGFASTDFPDTLCQIMAPSHPAQPSAAPAPIRTGGRHKARSFRLSLKPEIVFLLMAERVGFEPTVRLLDVQTISSRPRYGHFGTSPQ